MAEVADAPVDGEKLARQKKVKGPNGANVGFEAKVWAAADTLRNNMDAAKDKHVVLGLISLNISHPFKVQQA